MFKSIFVFVGSLVFTLFLPVLTEAAARNCSSAEQNAADAVLKHIEFNRAHQKKLIARHTPYGVHRTIDAAQASQERLLFQNGYMLLNDAELRTAVWVSYALTKQDVEASQGRDRVNCYRADPRIDPKRASNAADYHEPIYDQGHLASDADMKDELIEQLNTYVYSNISPQYCRFNRGIWLSLENLTRIWARKYGALTVVSGAIFNRNGMPGKDSDDLITRMKSRNGKARVAVPSAYYKIISRQERDQVYVISFLMPHTNADNGKTWTDVRPHVLSAISTMEKVEGVSGLDIHPNLRGMSVNELTENWDFTDGRSNLTPRASAQCVTSLLSKDSRKSIQ